MKEARHSPLFSLRRLYLTLVEILIVIMVLALMGGIIGINVTRALKEQRFRTEVDLLVDTLRLAQNLMLILGADVHVRLRTAPDKAGIEYMLDVEGGVPKNWEPIINRSRRLMKEVHGVSFREMQPFPIVEGQLDIRFQSGGSTMSKGVFRLSTHENERAPGAITMAVCLKGHPHPIIAVQEGKDQIQCEDGTDVEFNNRLTTSTIQEILEDNELTKKSATQQEEEKTDETPDTQEGEKQETKKDDVPKIP
jgi:type II secretory pathway pseudopilin PulG